MSVHAGKTSLSGMVHREVTCGKVPEVCGGAADATGGSGAVEFYFTSSWCLENVLNLDHALDP